MVEKIILKALAPHGDAAEQAKMLRRVADQVESGGTDGPGWRLTEIGSSHHGEREA